MQQKSQKQIQQLALLVLVYFSIGLRMNPVLARTWMLKIKNIYTWLN